MSPSVAAVLRFVFDRLLNPACQPSLSTHFFLPCWIYQYPNPYCLFVNHHFMRMGSAITRKWGDLWRKHNSVWLNECRRPSITAAKVTKA